jgi:hypothetical protein
VRAKILERAFLQFLPQSNICDRSKIANAAGVAGTANSVNKIFSIWLQGEEIAPEIVKACYRSVHRNCPQEHIILNAKTLSNYIDLPNYIMDKHSNGSISNAHFTDIARVELLYNHGGIWLDSTCFFTAPVSENILSQDFFLYLAGNAGSLYSFVQNCFIVSCKNTFLLGAWREMIFNYWKKEIKAVDYFQHQLLFKTLVRNNEKAKKYFEKIPHINQDPTHALWYDNYDKPFNQDVFNKLTGDTFFQKLTYRNVENAKSGSFADIMCKM